MPRPENFGRFPQTATLRATRDFLMMTKKSTKPWKKAPPKKSGHTKLTPQAKAKAKAAAKEAGRPYPNLIDNMKAAKKQKETKKA